MILFRISLNQILPALIVFTDPFFASKLYIQSAQIPKPLIGIPSFERTPELRYPVDQLRIEAEDEIAVCRDIGKDALVHEAPWLMLPPFLTIHGFFRKGGQLFQFPQDQAREGPPLVKGLQAGPKEGDEAQDGGEEEV